MQKKAILIIGQVWPEPQTTAAGQRMLQLIALFFEYGYTLHFACAAKVSEFSSTLTDFGVICHSIQINDSQFDELLITIQPEIVMYDRFIVEEQFGWRVSENLPNALTILDTEDLHSLRKTRELAIAKNTTFSKTLYIQQEITKREIASMYRCDLTLLISDYEMQLLSEYFNLDRVLLLHLPMFADYITHEVKSQWNTFENRQNFMTIGSGRHAPNVDSICYTIENIWPFIRKELPEASFEIYGAYLPQKVKQLHQPKKGIYIKGWIAKEQLAFQKARICLAPLRFGAGIKGKLLTAMQYGTPTITTPIGAEGMLPEDGDWNGFISEDPNQLAKAAVRLYTNKNLWLQCQQNGIELINTKFQKERYQSIVKDKIEYAKKDVHQFRAINFIGAMLRHHTLQSTKYLAKWIEEKNK